jgi:APA family basic amino acid/polyamine antiporter
MDSKAEAQSKVFVREATGLVKQISLFSTFAYNVNSQTVTVLVADYGAILAFLPGADATWAFIISILFAIPFLIIYAMFTAAMPRSGGDYVFISRTLAAPLGWLAAASIWVVEILFLGVNTSWIGSVYISSAFSLTGNLLKSSVLSNIATSASTPFWDMIIGTLVLVGIGLTLIFGVKVHFTFQNVIFVISVVAALVMIGVLLSATSSQFHSSFNSYAAPYTNASDPYSSVFSVAQAHGFTVAPASLYMTLVGGTSAFGSVAFGYFSTYGAGEMKRANSVKRQSIAMIGSVAFNAGLGLIIVALLLRVVGSNFLGASYYLASVSPSSFPYPVAPFLNLFVGMLTSSVALNLIMAIGWVAWGIATSTILFMMLTRMLFAWSYDRMIPSIFARVDDRFHGPIVATVAVILVAEVILYAFGLQAPGYALFFVAYIGTAIFVFTAFLLTPISAIIFPYRLRQIYNASPVARYKVGGVPLMSILGAITTAYMVMLIYFFLTVSSIGVNAPAVLESIATILIVSTVLYYVIKYVRRAQSVDIGLAFKEIPPE